MQKTKKHWKRDAIEDLEQDWKEHIELQNRRKEEIEKLARIAETAEKWRISSIEAKTNLEKIVSTNTQKISTGKYTILGWRKSQTKTRVVLQETKDIGPIVVWTTAAVSRVLEEAKHFYQFSIDKFGRELYWLVVCSNTIQIEVGQQTSFETKEGNTIWWYPIQILQAPNTKKLLEIQAILEEIQKYEDKNNTWKKGEEEKILQEIPMPPKNTIQKMEDILPGTYTCNRFASSLFRGKHRTILVLEKEEIEYPAYGYFLEKEIDLLGGTEELRKSRSYFVCKVGDVRTTPNKRKCRIVSVVSIPQK